MRIERLIKTGLPLIFLITGAILLIAGLFSIFIAAGKNKTCTATTTGVVTALEPRKKQNIHSGDKIPTYTWVPTYEYVVDGQTMMYRSNIGRQEGKFSLGQTVTVRYDPGQPDRAYVPEEQAFSVFLLLSAIGGVLLAVGAVAFALTRRLTIV